MSAQVAEADFEVKEFYDLGRVEIRSAVDPISLQASARRKLAFKQALGTAVQKATKGMFLHDVEVRLVWLIEEAQRYQTHLVADLDNVLKPMLDAITGPDGILIDDNQVQAIQASWMTPGRRTGFELTVSGLIEGSGDYAAREGMSFVEFSADRCYVVFPQAPGLMAQGYRRLVSAYQELVDAGIAKEDARSVLPIARPFPRARLGRFTVRHHTEYLEETDPPGR